MPVPDVLLARIDAAAGAVSGRPLILGIDGPSASGKSTLAGGLAAALGDGRAAVVEGDDFYADIDWALRAGFAVEEALARDYDWPRLRDQVLVPARDATPELRYRRYDWDAEAMGEWVELPTPEILIVEGLFILRPELRELVDFGIWVDAPRKLRLRRQRQRHALYPPEIRDRQNAEIERWAATEEHYLAVSDPRPRAELVLETR